MKNHLLLQVVYFTSMLKIDDFASFRRVATPFYYYDIDLFRRTADKVA